jgi:cold shock CspA family protein
MTKVSGRVAWFSNRKGYGFVCSPQVAEQNEIFVHHTSIVSPDGMYRTLVREFESFLVPEPGPAATLRSSPLSSA